jgi:hypothetical protein
VITQDVNFLNLERKEIQGSFTNGKTIATKTKPLSATINDVLKKV